MKKRTLEQHLFDAGPKRILSLDGGGVRGIVTLAYLRKVEDLLRKRLGAGPEFRLSHYFDLIGGTSTGAIIAAGLALGYGVQELQKLYHDLATLVFKAGWIQGFIKNIPLLGKLGAVPFGLIWAKFPEGPLKKLLETDFDCFLGGPGKDPNRQLETGLGVMAKRLDTGSPWIFHNNPQGKYFAPSKGNALRNRDFQLPAVVRASTAAPTFFDPETIEVARRPEDGSYVDGVFVDGGVSPYNNPALQLFMLATLKGYRLNWTANPDSLLLVSVGTGSKDVAIPRDKIKGMTAVEVSVASLLSLMDDCDALSRTVLQWISESPTREKIDSEVGDLGQDCLGDRKLLTYLRYNLKLEPEWLREMLKVNLDDDKLEGLHAMDNPANLDLLESLGEAAREVQVREDHFPPAFDTGVYAG